MHLADRWEASLNVLDACLQCSAQSDTQPFLEGRQRGLSKQEDTVRSAQQVPVGEFLNGLSGGVLGRSPLYAGSSQHPKVTRRILPVELLVQ